MSTIEEIATEMARRLSDDPGHYPLCVWQKKGEWAADGDYGWGYGPHEHPDDCRVPATEKVDPSDSRPLNLIELAAFTDELSSWLRSVVEPPTNHLVKASGVGLNQQELWTDLEAASGRSQ